MNILTRLKGFENLVVDSSTFCVCYPQQSFDVNISDLSEDSPSTELKLNSPLVHTSRQTHLCQKESFSSVSLRNGHKLKRGPILRDLNMTRCSITSFTSIAMLWAKPSVIVLIEPRCNSQYFLPQRVIPSQSTNLSGCVFAEDFNCTVYVCRDRRWITTCQQIELSGYELVRQSIVGVPSRISPHYLNVVFLAQIKRIEVVMDFCVGLILERIPRCIVRRCAGEQRLRVRLPITWSPHTGTRRRWCR